MLTINILIFRPTKEPAPAPVTPVETVVPAPVSITAFIGGKYLTLYYTIYGNISLIYNLIWYNYSFTWSLTANFSRTRYKCIIIEELILECFDTCQLSANEKRGSTNQITEVLSRV